MIIVVDRLAKINEICKNNNCVFIECLNIDEHKFQKVQIKFICSCGKVTIEVDGEHHRRDVLYGENLILIQ